ncbi:chemotaxis protein CheD [Halarsenatibacter silvermanii]|uniref:Probable chemoreceptor glutamine deamidase CheD n=1 Tax=Halarsenatibacter silvermanii TaxID=321763 RepID=A0A1G9LFT9_9FIRM|nr:chemotaxis protein CheD [Halarsenatibacter silvermanii]SDL60657.1 chemotaxis protein CheD [Halarsenatibacter silvermanii]
MDGENIKVRMAEYGIGSSPDKIVTIGLGSCLGITLFDPRKKLGGMVHIMLPENKKNLKPAKYADTGLPLLVEEMEKKGASRRRFEAKIAGGASMFSVSENSSLDVGRRNIKKVESVLDDLNIDILGKDVGENFGRTMEFYTSTGEVIITSHQRDELSL